MTVLKKIDYHIHTDFSDGQPSYIEVLDRARELGMDCIAITDHFDRYDANERIRSITDDELLDYFKMISEYAEEINQEVFCGIETCTDFEGNIRLSDRVLNNCDLIITSPHYIEYEGDIKPGNYYDDSFWDAYKNKVLNMAKSPGDILGHCEGYLPYGRLLVPGKTTYEERQSLSRRIAARYFDDEYIEKLIGRLKISGKALELHCVTGTPRECLIDKAVENGIPLSMGSDAHVLSGVGNTAWGMGMIESYGGKAMQFIKQV